MRRPFHVVNRRKKDFDIVEIDLDDVLFVGSYNGEKYLQTPQGAFYYIKSPEEQERFFEMQGFIKLDRCFMAQESKIEFYDEEMHHVFFEPEPISRNALRAPVSRAHYHAVKQIRRGKSLESTSNEWTAIHRRDLATE
ncbi:hypothetical protein [Paenibacillus sp. BC26]|uniref:hypothetical protein n=1 Tax=Paenibacillus sp. BC26 TaxID=1881032 RepID=UPI0008EBCA17|nr:hypothetical protein [Paenibacillus sp. BC26]SFS83949.1 hypothetical protein SAMN05428962_3174 [Paenibacillus sp. BC26]